MDGSVRREEERIGVVVMSCVPLVADEGNR